MFRVGIDASSLTNEYQYRGIGNYTRHIIEYLPRVSSEIEVITDQNPSCDIFLQPNFKDGLPQGNFPKIIMVHDIIPLVLNRFSEKGYLINLIRKYQYLWQLRILNRADHLLVNSTTTKIDLSQRLYLTPEKISVVYLGVDERYLEGSEVRSRRSEVGGQKYLLHVGGVEANKNVLRMLEAYKMLPENIKNEYKLKIAGGDFLDEKRAEAIKIRQKIKELDLETRVELLGHVNDEDMPLLYSSASLFLYPTLYEGFGFPILEAMACACPVITSDVSSIPEIAEHAVYFINPYNIPEITNAIVRVLGDELLKGDLIKRGLEQAKKFSWEKTAKETLEVLIRVKSNYRGA